MSSNVETVDRDAPEIEASSEYLTFVLGDEFYGLDILKVQEIRGYDAVTKIANTPDFIKGVINLRGLIVPIVDLRIKFNLGSVTYDALTVVIILNLGGRVAGIVVDGVSDVMNLPDNQIRVVPDIVASIDTKYITGLATVEEKMLVLVDIEHLMTSPEMELTDVVGD
ncbi:MAG TPA: chemotaxis protein CheW [Methylophilaceae bacterium]|jgi:purine-binding chemotaxis protein CheW